MIEKLNAMSYQRLAIVLGHCLFPSHQPLKPSENTLFFMAEDADLCTHFSYHKHKLVLFLSAMRQHAKAVKKDYPLHYVKLNKDNFKESYWDKLTVVLKQNPDIQELVTYDVEDHFFDKQLRAFAERQNLKLTVINSPGFIFPQSDFREYKEHHKRPFLQNYYKERRKRLNILMQDNGEPLHGSWSFDAENRKKFPKEVQFPKRITFERSAETKDVMKLVEALFPDHPGRTENFNWATTTAEAREELERFLQHKLMDFGPYEDAIDAKEVFAFHAVLSPYLNMGLLPAPEVLERTLAFAERQDDVHFPSLEGFVRQIMGWREFMRGIYHNYSLRKNYFGQERRLTRHWYEGTTGIAPLDDSINKAQTHGYTHHIERLMILGNIMLLADLHPDEVYRWFMEMYVDSADWVMEPNVYGMSQFAEGGIFATKPYIGGSNYIRKMSRYPKGDWCDIVDGLYWRFIDKHRDTFAKNRRMSMMVATLRKMNDERRSYIFQRAEKWIEEFTQA